MKWSSIDLHNIIILLQIHAVDKRVVSRIVTSEMLYKKHTPTSNPVMSESSATVDAIAPGRHDVDVQFDVSSLMPNSRCLVMLISAFCRKKGKNFLIIKACTCAVDLYKVIIAVVTV